MTGVETTTALKPFASPERDNSLHEAGTREADFSFDDFLDIINPLQHVPVVSTIYRELTGDTIEAPSRIIGGMIFGGPLGMASSVGSAMLEEATGKDVGDTMMAALFGEDETPPADAPALAEGTASPAGEGIQVAARNGHAEAQAAAPATDGPPTSASHSGGEEGLSGLDALRAFARDQSGGGKASGGGADMQAPTTAATTSGQAPVQQAAVDEDAAEAALRAAAGVSGEEGLHQPGRDAQARAVPGSPPPPEQFMPLTSRAFAGPVPVSASRSATAMASNRSEAADPLGTPDPELGSAGDYVPGDGSDADHPIAQQMRDALLKYQELREG